MAASNSACKVMVILGTRPEGIKMVPVIQALRQRSESGQMQVQVCVTGQHREMLDQVLRLFGIVPDIDLNLMQPGQTLSQVAARVLLGLEPVLKTVSPEWVLVQGDTTSVMAAAIAAHHLNIRVGHVEAGLRTGDRLNPFPEEMNRVIAGHVSDIHFAPTPRARENLLREGIADWRIHLTGNTVVDALLSIAERPMPESVKNIIEDGRRLLLVTAHRRENFGKPLMDICQAIRILVQQHPDVQIVFPVHLNPSVKNPVYDVLGGLDSVSLLPPVDYLTLVHLMKASYAILTDSGGIQEEAPSLGKPVLVLRQTTERPEAIEAGAARLVGTETEQIVSETNCLLNDPRIYTSMAKAVNPYGDGHAAERIVDILSKAEQSYRHC